MADPSAQDVNSQIMATVDRLFRQFDGAVPKETLSSFVADAITEWKDARVKMYVPVLAERSVRARLRAQQAGRRAS